MTNKKKLADHADIHALYEQSVQCVEDEIDFVDKTFAQLQKRKARLLREDFCGTASASCAWVSRRKTNQAISVDLDAVVLAWGHKNNISKLTKQQKTRIKTLNIDVRKVKNNIVDIVLAMNFSYWIFKTRNTMINYFKGVYNSLENDGVFFLDTFGGHEAYQTLEETTEHDEFTYIWEQASYNPINNHLTCYIHFKFKDNSKINKAFTYRWRLWSLPEITEMLVDVGFKTTVYWEGTNAKNEGNGIFKPTKKALAEASWIAYIVAKKTA
ncbi:expressed protein [uncultured Candidatus Thioglobus sp.]|nr:expressed protein [uncultured Candidatus Thioglobus sp.]